MPENSNKNRPNKHKTHNSILLNLHLLVPGKSGFSTRSLRDTKRFYLFYSSEFWRQLVAKLNFLPNLIH
jgi:hypothetical protein